MATLFKQLKGISVCVTDTKANLEATVKVWPKGILIYEQDTDKIKITNGNDLYSDLPYITDVVSNDVNELIDQLQQAPNMYKYEYLDDSYEIVDGELVHS